MNAQLQNNRPANPVVAFNAFMQKHKSQLELALPKHLNADRMVRLSLTAFSQNPTLQQCDPKSIFGSIIVASQLGLEIGVNGQGYLVPYKGKCTFVPGWKGLVDLANRGGRCTVWTGAVYEGDEFDYMLGDSPYCKHKPCGEFEESKLTHVYAIGRVKDSEMPVIEVWPVKKVHAHFKKTVVPALQPNHYSKKHFEAYAKKVALLQVLKYMPQSIEMSNAVDVSYAAEQGKGITIDGDFVSVDNTPDVADQNTQNPAQNGVETVIDHAPVQEEEVVYAPTYEQIKRGILTAKSPAHLDVMEEQVMDHVNKDERKALMQLVKAQSEKFKAVEALSGKKRSATSKVEPPIQEAQPETTDDGLSGAKKLAQLAEEAEAAIAQQKKPSSADLKKEFAKRLNLAKSLVDVLDIEEEIENANGLIQADFQYLQANIEQVRAKFEQAKQTAAVDPIKSNAVKQGLLRMISEAPNLEQLTAVAQQINESKPKLANEHHQELLSAYAGRKAMLDDQNDMFND